MQQSHKIGFAEYERKLEKRISVEKRRHHEYDKCKKIVAEIDNQLHK
ncbi:hypothetical protein GCM10009001_00990 [Virgibacillus siamensis]|uniref:Uncharacterized protein n=2 Tax=Virgibacillus siamensis TaxID=480071 RepID=A0ABN1FE22_9BACI